MSAIHYFQRYSQKENTATNNTLLLFSRLYKNSPLKFKVFFNQLLNDVDFDIGIQFSQQEKNSESVPDGIISQDSFKLLIETKLNSKDFNIKQFKNHLKSFNDESFQILLALSPGPIKSEVKKKITQEISAYNLKHNLFIKFVDITFKQIIEKFREVIHEYDFELLEIIEDYEDYCNSSQLISNHENKMRVIPCGGSINENLANNIYYAPSKRNPSEHSYIGLYTNKMVKAIGKLSNIINANLIGDQLEIKHSLNDVSATEKSNILKIISEAKKNNGWDISRDHSFFCVDKFVETEFKKETKYALQGSKFFNLNSVLNTEELPPIDEIASLLKNKKW